MIKIYVYHFVSSFFLIAYFILYLFFSTQKLEYFLHTGYAIIIVSIFLMLWISYSSAAICQFDAQCTCTSSYPNWGQVQCHNAIVHLSPFNTTKLFTLSLINNRLDYLPPRLLQGTGIK